MLSIALASAAITFAGISPLESSLNKTEENVINRNAAENTYLDGKIAERSGDSSTALKYYLSAWKLDPTSNFLTSYTSTFALYKGKPAEAVYVISGGIPYAALNDDKLHQLSKIFISYAHYAEALQVYREIDSLSYNDSLIFADLLAENQKFSEAATVIASLDVTNDSLLQFKRADLYRRANNGAEALKLFKKLTMRFPSDQAILKGLGLSILAFGSEQEAMNILTAFLPPNSAPDEQVMELVGRYHASKGRYDQAIPLFKKLYTKDGSARDYYFGRPLAIFSFLDGQHENARTLMESLLVKNNFDFELYFLLGSVYEALNNTTMALDSYSKSIQIDTTFEEPYRAIVLAYVRSGNTDKALVEALNYTQKFVKTPESWALYGSLLTMEKRYNEAVLPLSKAVGLYGGTVPSSVQFEYAMALERSGQSSDAEREFLKLANNERIHPAAANYLGYMWAEQNKNLTKAKKLIRAALDADPENGAYLDSYGWVLYRLNEYELSFNYLTQALATINDDYVVYYHLGVVLEKLNRPSEAIIQFQKSLQFENSQKDEILSRIDKLEAVLMYEKQRNSGN